MEKTVLLVLLVASLSLAYGQVNFSTSWGKRSVSAAPGSAATNAAVNAMNLNGCRSVVETLLVLRNAIEDELDRLKKNELKDKEHKKLTSAMKLSYFY